MKGRSVTLKLKRRKEGAPEPSKFMVSSLSRPAISVCCRVERGSGDSTCDMLLSIHHAGPRDLLESE